ncbi:hypothetical protein KIN20_038467 [Parelaphostrongylus tenuis]|uniref:Uncharacterized protein n=1 Tax=Parelaphostrongylus tenuis TaxID=148309 RepID=A0AAD5RED1_PARTN|nr:hypothetical protein KIN20_038467 [Parelaphostrongylus tenuis]
MRSRKVDARSIPYLANERKDPKFDLRQRSKIKDTDLHARISKTRWVEHVMRFKDNRWMRAVTNWISRDIKRFIGRPPTRWSDFFTKGIEKRYDAHRIPRAWTTHWAILAHDREKWKCCWYQLESPDDQRDDSDTGDPKNSSF